MRRAARVDENHAEIVSAFRRLGASVADLSRCGDGIPDLAIGVNRQMRFVEVKRDAKAKFKPSQLDFMTWWSGPPVVRVDCIEQAAELVRLMRGMQCE